VTFAAFTPRAVDFLRGLKENNTKEWFHAHRKVYEDEILEPAKALVVELGDRLRSLSPEIQYEPRVPRSIGRPNRDVRSSKDKSPYKTHLDLWFWEGRGGRGGESGYFFRMRADSLMLGAGMHSFNEDLLAPYQETLATGDRAHALARIARELKGNGYELAGRGWKQVAAISPSDLPHHAQLRQDGLVTSVELSGPELTSSELPDLCLRHWSKMAPLERWLADLLAGEP
jgi:uncharacterized protein (TIGR02453 family)